MELAATVRTTAPHTRTLKLFLLLLLLAAAAEFIVRGPLRFVRAAGTWNDLSQNYATSKLWLAGENPCNPNNFIRVWLENGQSRLSPNDIRTHLAPPLGTFVLLAPLAALPWPIAKIAWLVILLFAFGFALWSLFRVGKFCIDDPRALVFLALALALAPFHTGFASGNSSVLVIALCIIAIWAAETQRDVLAGILLAVASSLKPQIGGLFVLYYLLCRRWRIFFLAAGISVALVAIAAASLQIHAPGWSHDFLNNVKGFSSSNTIDDFRASNPIRFTLINLQVPFYSMTSSRAAANLLALSCGGIFICIWIYGVIRYSGPNSALRDLGAVAVVALLPVYHRFYDAAVLLIPLGWYLSRPIRSKISAGLALLFMVPFFVPGAAWLELLAAHGHISDSVSRSWWWNTIVAPHEAWALLFLSLILLYNIFAPDEISHRVLTQGA